jgi:hypothetical protein
MEYRVDDGKIPSNSRGQYPLLEVHGQIGPQWQPVFKACYEN